MDDLVDRLITARYDDHERGCQMRFVVCSCGYDDQTARAVGDAKDRIEALQAEVARLRDALAHMANTINIVGSDYEQSLQAMDRLVVSVKKQARQALKGSTDE